MTKKLNQGKTPFSLDVCNAIRHHAASVEAAESRRKIAFDERDAAEKEKHELANRDSKEYLEACRRHSDAIESIDGLNSDIKFHNKTLVELATNADTPGLEVLYERPAEPPPKKKDQMEFGGVGGEGGGAEKDERPVGRPRQKQAAIADGVAEHLKASVNELDLHEQALGLLIKGGFETVAQLVDKVDDANLLALSYRGSAKTLLIDEIGCSEKEADAILKALAFFRKKHRRAAAEAEKVA